MPFAELEWSLPGGERFPVAFRIPGEPAPTTAPRHYHLFHSHAEEPVAGGYRLVRAAAWRLDTTVRTAERAVEWLVAAWVRAGRPHPVPPIPSAVRTHRALVSLAAGVDIEWAGWVPGDRGPYVRLVAACCSRTGIHPPAPPPF
ncbi:hypothetical protein [Kitasatospora sp. NPDC088351]|uniref:hypothetical protein n=1 Tax=unclassified Kitasatospora TaxID=2633591 RepID=UPI00341FBCFA